MWFGKLILSLVYITKSTYNKAYRPRQAKSEERV